VSAPRRFPLVVPLVRAMPWPATAALLALGVLPAAVTAARGGSDLGGAVVACAVVASAVVAYAFDEQARSVLNASPVASSRREVVRLTLLLGAVAGAALVVASIAGSRDPAALDHLDARLAEATATGALSLAVAALEQRRDGGRTSLGAVLSGPLAVLTISAVASRVPWLPSLGMAPDAGRWWVVAAAASAVAAWYGGDPYRRRRIGRRLFGLAGPPTEGGASAQPIDGDVARRTYLASKPSSE
jgi:hypothetical protein